VVGSRISIEFLLETLASGMTIPEIVEEIRASATRLR